MTIMRTIAVVDVSCGGRDCVPVSDSFPLPFRMLDAVVTAEKGQEGSSFLQFAVGLLFFADEFLGRSKPQLSNQKQRPSRNTLPLDRLSVSQHEY